MGAHLFTKRLATGLVLALSSVFVAQTVSAVSEGWGSAALARWSARGIAPMLTTRCVHMLSMATLEPNVDRSHAQSKLTASVGARSMECAVLMLVRRRKGIYHTLSSLAPAAASGLKSIERGVNKCPSRVYVHPASL